MTTAQIRQSKILNHAEGMGAVSLEQVEQRACELAIIAGRAHGKFTKDDLDQASRELHGGHPDLANNGDGELEGIIAECGAEAVSTGHQTAEYSSEPDLSVAEELVAEGMDEAEHEQMLAARNME